MPAARPSIHDGADETGLSVWRSRKTTVERWTARPAHMICALAGIFDNTASNAHSKERTSSSGSCCDHAALGRLVLMGSCAEATTFPLKSKITAREDEEPWSSARTSDFTGA